MQLKILNNQFTSNTKALTSSHRFWTFFALLISGLLVNSPALMADEYGPYKGKILEVIEGDTIKVAVDIWPGLTQEIYVRLKDIDAPEPKRVRGGRPVANCEAKAAEQAIAHVEQIVASSDQVEISSVELVTSTAQYVYAYIKVGNIDIGESLVSNGLAISQLGLKRKRWSCRNL